MRRVYVAETLVDAQLVMDLLAHNGIKAKLFNENGQGALGELPVTYPEVWACEDRDGEKALLLINEFSALPEQDGAQTCTRCGESSPASFDICWFCLLYTSPSPRDATLSRMPSSA